MKIIIRRERKGILGALIPKEDFLKFVTKNTLLKENEAQKIGELSIKPLRKRR